MDPINPLDGIAELLRKRVGSERLAGKNRSSETKKSAAPSAGESRIDAQTLKQQVIQAVEGIDIDDPQRKKKATRIFVENVLTWEFGAELINDPSFSRLVDEVQIALEQEPSLIDLLLASGSPAGKK